MNDKIFTEIVEDQGNYDNIIVSLRLEKLDIPLIGDILEIYLNVLDRQVIKRKMKYLDGKLDSVRIYV